MNRQYKSSIFTLLFSDKTKLIHLYNAIEGTNYGPDAQVKINTLKRALVLGRTNDVSFTIDDKLVVLIEHQSTINPNMPLRGLIYVSELYKKLIPSNKTYASQLFKIPAPQLIVLYNGNAPYPDKTILKLSDAYKETLPGADFDIEVKVTVYNINDGHNSKMIQKSQELYGYVQFVACVKGYIKKKFTRDAAIEAALLYCIENGILADFLKAHGSEVTNMIFTEFNLEDALKVWKEEGIEIGREEGLKKGRVEGRLEGQTEKSLAIAENLKREGMSNEKIAVITGLSMQELLKTP